MMERTRSQQTAGTPAIGVDIGGVVIRQARAREDTSFFSQDFLQTPEVEGAISAIAHLNASVFPGGVWIVSKALAPTAERTLLWLEDRGFEAATGVAADRILFCERREDKAPIAKDLGLTAFVDDRVDVLAPMTTVGRRLLFREPRASAPSAIPAGVTPVAGWAEALRTLDPQSAA